MTQKRSTPSQDEDRPATGPPLGALVAVCGIDGSGKSTLAAAIVEQVRARGRTAEIYRPLAGERGFVSGVTALRNRAEGDQPEARAATEHFLAAYFSFVLGVRTASEVVPALARSDVVVCDRYLTSHRVNQAVFGNSLGPYAWLLGDLPVPRLTLLLDIDPETAAERIAARGSAGAFDRASQLRSARERFLSHAAAEGFVVFDAQASPEELCARAMTHVERLLPAGVR